jgi:hypothetical protein
MGKQVPAQSQGGAQGLELLGCVIPGARHGETAKTVDEREMLIDWGCRGFGDCE